MDSSSTTSDRKRYSKPNNVLFVPVKTSKEFFRRWCEFLRPIIKLTDKELEVVASLLMHRYELSKRISDPIILDKVVMNDATRDKVLKDCSISLKYYYVITSNLRKNKVLIKNTLNPRLIPNIKESEDGRFQLTVLFESFNKTA